MLSLLVAPTQDVADRASGSRWPASATALGDYATVFAGVAGWAIFGTTLAVDLPLGAARARRRLRLGRPVREHRRRLVGRRLPVFPGQVLASLIRGGTIELGMGRAVVTAAVYTAIAAAAVLLLVSRRDVTLLGARRGHAGRPQPRCLDFRVRVAAGRTWSTRDGTSATAEGVSNISRQDDRPDEGVRQELEDRYSPADHRR